MEFTNRGLITPPKIHKMTKEVFYEEFVLNFPKSSNRQRLYDAFDDYTERFTNQITDKFVQWIGGSFTTQKLNPNDIDLLTILPRAVFEKYENLLKKEFTSKSSDSSSVDSYFLGVRETDDPKFPLYRSDYIYWLH